MQTLNAIVYDIIGRRRAALTAAQHDEEKLVSVGPCNTPCLTGAEPHPVPETPVDDALHRSDHVFRQETCLLDALLLSEDEDGRRMTDVGIRDELMTLLIAGQAGNLRL